LYFLTPSAFQVSDKTVHLRATYASDSQQDIIDEEWGQYPSDWQGDVTQGEAAAGFIGYCSFHRNRVRHTVS
jgi:hypothetical protein